MTTDELNTIKESGEFVFMELNKLKNDLLSGKIISDKTKPLFCFHLFVLIKTGKINENELNKIEIVY